MMNHHLKDQEGNGETFQIDLEKIRFKEGR